MIQSPDIEENTTPFYLTLASAAWRLFINNGFDNAARKTRDRLDNACIKLFFKLDESDRALLSFFNGRNEPTGYVLSGYAKETGIALPEVRTRFNWLCYRVAVEAGVINRFAWIEPPQHYKQIQTTKKGTKDNGQQEDQGDQPNHYQYGE